MHQKRKTTRGSWTLQSMEMATSAIQQQGMSIRKAAETFGVPKSTLERHLNKKIACPGSLGGRQPVLDAVFETQLVEHILQMQKRFFGLSPKELKKLAFDLAEQNKLNHPFSLQLRMAGKDWLRAFIARHPEISSRKPEATSLTRAVGFNRAQVKIFYDILKAELESHTYTPDRIWNADESGLTAVHKPGKILAAKGQKQVGKMTSGERGRTITILCCVSAVRSYVPPLMIFPRKYMNDRLMHNAPPLAIGLVSDSGWINEELFVKWLQHFGKCTNSSTSNKQLLIVDGHGSHKSLAAITLARQLGITMISLPPHTTHKLQPLDRAFFGPLKCYFNQACDQWMVNHPGHRITDYEMAGLFGQAYVKAASMEKGVNSFKGCGIYPFNPDVFDESEFAPALMTDRDMPQDDLSATSEFIIILLNKSI